MKRFLAIALLLMNVSLANAQAPTPLCTPGVSPTSGQPTCVPVNGANPLPISGSFSANLTGFLSNGSFATLTATGSTSASTALPVGVTVNPSVRITNNGTTVVSCTMATGAATGLASNILVQPGSSVSRVVGAFDHIACIDQTGSVSNPVVIEGGSGLGNDSGGGGSGGGGGSVTQGTTPWVDSITTWGGGTLGAMTNFGTTPGAVLVPGANVFVINAPANGAHNIANSPTVNIATDSQTIPVGLQAIASGGWTPKWFIAAASDNSTNIKASAGIVHAVQVFGIASAPAYLKFYDKATAPTCGSDTIVKQVMIPAAATAANGSGAIAVVLDAQFSTGIAYCVVTGITATDDTSPSASQLVINIDWK